MPAPGFVNLAGCGSPVVDLEAAFAIPTHESDPLARPRDRESPRAEEDKAPAPELDRNQTVGLPSPKRRWDLPTPLRSAIFKVNRGGPAPILRLIMNFC